uniref:Uncharacterized protein n=1 Tax=Acrosorium ciliolatum TaxID=1550622 RepID=A0A1Z1M2G5_9FLOR|nr:hypothetical protein [Acrosorium ciliolatum]ARW59975.1 hypothetical protein [Acrosorium ciliolatum]
MTFDFTTDHENNKYNQYIDINNDNDIDILDVPVAWSAICFNETINYYTDCNTKSITTNIE